MEKLRTQAMHAKESDEYVDILAVPARAEDVRRMLKEQSASFSPVGHGCLALFGRVKNWW
jgi:hypothetical protein